jgi:hypothetical protein
MPTHTDNRHYGTFITDSPITVETINALDGINGSAIYSFIPRPYDLSHQLDGQTLSFDLPGRYAAGTLEFFALFLDGDLLPRATNAEDQNGDYYIEGDKKTVVLRGNQLTPVSTQILIAVYVKQQTIV